MHEAAPKLLEDRLVDQKGQNELEDTAAVVQNSGACRDIKLQNGINNNDLAKNRHVKV